MNPSPLQTRQLVDRLHWGVVLTPIVTVLLFYTMVLHARLTIGEWPSRQTMDFNAISGVNVLFGFHCAIIFVALALTSTSPVAWLALLSQAHHLPSLKAYAIRFAAFVLSLAFAVWIGTQDPGHFLNWFFD